MDFKPTLHMRRMKAALHRNCPPSKLQMLTPADKEIWRYIAPIRLQFLTDCLKTYGEEFWVWLLTPEEEDGKREMLIDTAKDVLDRVLQMELYDPLTGKPDVKLVRVIASVALELLRLGKEEKPLVQVMQVNTQDIPKGIKGKTETELEDRLRTMLKHLPPETGLAEEYKEIVNPIFHLDEYRPTKEEGETYSVVAQRITD